MDKDIEQQKQEKSIAKDNTKYQKSNLFINAKTKRSLQEEKMLAIAMSRVQKLPEVDGNIVCEMSAAELRKLFNDESGSLYSHLQQISNRFMNNGMIGYTDAENNRFDYLHVVTRAKYEGGVFTLKFNGDLKDHLIGMSKNYTLLDMPTMMKFNSVYSFRIYEIIKSKEYTLTYKKENPCDSYELEFNLSEFKFQIGVADVSEKKVQDILAGSHTPNWDKAIEVCENQAYKDWRNFKRFVLDVAQKEINSSTDLILEYEFARGGKGGKIVGIKLLVTPKENAATEVSDVMDKEPKAKVVKKKKKKVSELQKLEMIENVIEFIEEKITMKDARALLEACDYEIEKLEEKYRIAKKQGKIENLVGWLIKACVDEYSEPVSVKEKKGQNTFNNFTQNSYDFTELEKKLLDN